MSASRPTVARSQRVRQATTLGLVLVALVVVVAVRWFYAGDAGSGAGAADAVAAWDETEAAAAVEAPALTAPPPAPSVERAELRLLSTAISRDPSQSTATILLGKRGGRRAMRPGDTVADGSVMEWVEPRRVGFRSDSERWTLDLSPEPPPAAATASQDVAPEGFLRPPDPDSDRPGNKPLLDMLRDEPGRVNLVNLLSEADFAFRFDERNGDILGMKLTDVPRDSAYGQLGFKSGDVLLAVNGIQIDSPEAAETAFGEMERTSELRIRFERDERTEEMSVSRIVTPDSLGDEGSSS